MLILKLSDKLFIIIHLRISGSLFLGKKEGRYARIIFKLSDGRWLQFCDGRVLGELRLVNDWRELPIVKTMGPEPLDLTRQGFVKLFTGKKTKIKPLLMDQAFIAGIGNIYAQEAVFCAGIHPQREANKLNAEDLVRLYNCLLKVLREGIKNKGTSADSYYQLDGSKGGNVPYLKVYQRDNQPCLKCKTPLKRIVVAGRGTTFCPHCQK